MNKKPFYAIALAEDGRSATIAVRGTIGDWFEGKSIEQMEYDIARIGAVDEITVRITSFGGKLDHGLAMHNALRRHPARVVAIVEGVAASAGSIVAMAADEIRMYANSTMMIHGVTLLDDEGNPVENDAAARALNASLIETYVARTGKSADEIAALIATDTWMTAREAVAAGFANSVIEIAGAQSGAAQQASAASPLAAIAAAIDIPPEVIARAVAQAAEQSAEQTADIDAGTGNPPTGTPPAKPETTPAPVAVDACATFAAQINALAVANGMGDHVAAWLLDGDISTPAQAEAAIKEAREVRDLCAFANAAERAPAFIRARRSLADVRAALINDAAARADANPTDSTPRAVGAKVPSSGAAVWDKIFPTRQTKE